MIVIATNIFCRDGIHNTIERKTERVKRGIKKLERLPLAEGLVKIIDCFRGVCL
jgi:hypothetical protein